MPKRFPGRMTFTQWKRTPWRKKYRIVGVALNTTVFRYWRDCADARCRRARTCCDFECYWRRLESIPSFDDRMRVREKAKPLERLLWIGSRKGSEGRVRY